MDIENKGKVASPEASGDNVVAHALLNETDRDYWPESMAAAMLTVAKGAHWQDSDIVPLKEALYLEPDESPSDAREVNFLKVKRLIASYDLVMKGTALDPQCFSPS